MNPVVYFVQQNNGPVKIGYASVVADRVAGLQGANPYPLRVRALVPATRTLEAELHFMFSDARLIGEWFDMRRSPDLEAFVGSAFKLLLHHVLPVLTMAASEMAEHLYVPQIWLNDVQRAMDGMAEDLMASVPGPLASSSHFSQRRPA